MTKKKLCAKCFVEGYFSSVRPPAFNYRPPYLCRKCWQSWSTFCNSGKGYGMSFLSAFHEWLGRMWNADDPYGNNQDNKPVRVIFT